MLMSHTQANKYNSSGIYQIKYIDSPLRYIEQTGRTFNIISREHIRAIISNNSNSGYSDYTLNTRHTHGAITGTMDIIRTGKKAYI
jgi:hypothetical protein